MPSARTTTEKRRDAATETTRCPAAPESQSNGSGCGVATAELSAAQPALAAVAPPRPRAWCVALPQTRSSAAAAWPPQSAAAAAALGPPSVPLVIDGLDACAASRTPSAARTLTPSEPSHGAATRAASAASDGTGGASSVSTSVVELSQRASTSSAEPAVPLLMLPYGGHVHASPAASVAASRAQPRGAPPMSVGSEKWSESASPAASAPSGLCAACSVSARSVGPSSEPQSPTSASEHVSLGLERLSDERSPPASCAQQTSEPTPAGVAAPRARSAAPAVLALTTVTRSVVSDVHCPVTSPSAVATSAPLLLVTWQASSCATDADASMPGWPVIHRPGAMSVGASKLMVRKSPAP